MILIFSINSDYSTSSVISWLIRLQKPFIRINEDTAVELLWLTSADFAISIDGETILSSQITKMWYRRGGLNLFAWFKSELIKDYLRSEHTALIDYFYHRLDQIPSVNKFRNSDINKLYLMDLCEKHGVLAPRYLVTGCKNEVMRFFEEEKSIISKPFNSPFSVQDEEDFSHMAYTSMIDQTDIEALPERFIPTFFQQAVAKAYEIRVFYLNGKFYSMAIFSQNNANTNIDFRNYDRDKPNRLAPYRLEKAYESKLQKMLEAYGLNCASFDIIYSSDDAQYYFLDLNPVGQFGMVSAPCNYNLEKEIALAL
ncbi:grasp-with-spasm system ATP-grasp peptide maturase [Pedobacter sp. SYP-B3415]|uniref:grasp-with-spasm system ATP-grasp peptide maturase n=1 Tax=Pedobacter sp. SYP-B3415 TaxID=2496641 RepID=UPI00101CB7CD|nr:grasp-with-spasm system ATP-grasp peptide maturase [Pedobacter sp. SYP-B3415]